METPTAQIIAIDGGSALLRIDAAAACARCAAGKGCGAGLLTAGAKQREVWMPLPEGTRFAAGDRVHLTLQPSRLLEAAVYAYGLPLLALTLAPLLASWAWGPLHDAALVAIAVAAVAVAVIAGRRLLARGRCLEQLMPAIAGLAAVESR